jgi:hypothetical protein
MKLKVLKRFHDKVTGEAYEVGSIIEPTNERGAELLAAKGDLVEKISGSDDEPETDVQAEKPKTKKKK